MNIEKEDIVTAFEKSIRNRYYKLFDYYEDWFLNKTYLAVDIAHKISADLGIIITPTSVKYIRSKIQKSRLLERVDKSKKSDLLDHSKSQLNPDKANINHLENSTNDFEFKEPKSIDHNQQIVTIRKSTHEAN